MADRRDGKQQAVARSSAVDPDLKRRLEEAYLNDEEDVLVVSAVRSVDAGATVVVELQPPHGEATHTLRFDGPKHGSLDECAELLAFLDAAGVSPLELDALVGTRVPAAFDAETGWRVDEAYVPSRGGEAGNRSRFTTVLRGAIDWIRSYRDWLLIVVIIGVELLLVVVLILLFA